MDIRQFSSVEELRDGVKVGVRAINPEDKELLRQGFEHLSSDSVKFRFFGLKNELSQDELRYFTGMDFDRHVALAVTVPHEDQDQIIGVGRYIELTRSDDVRSAEIALAVIDDYQNKGIGSLLFERLMGIARSKGIEQFEADIFAENCRVVEIFKHHGHDFHCSRDSEIMHITCRNV